MKKIQKWQKILILGLASALVFSGCGQHAFTSGPSALEYNSGQQENPAPGEEKESEEISAPLSFDQVRKEIFEPRCQRCHSGRFPDVSNHASVLANLESIRSAIESDFMPPRNPLSAKEKELFLRWIAEGAH